MKELSDVNNTYVIDPEDAAETARLMQQAREVNRVVGLFPQGMDVLKADARILDVGCGTGDWCLDVAFEMPLACVVGIDLSQTQIRYATQRALSRESLFFTCYDAQAFVVGNPVSIFEERSP